MNVSSYYQALTSFRSQDLWTMSQSVILDTIPVVPVLRSLFDLFTQCHPQFCRNDDVNDPTGEDFILSDSKERMEQVVDLYMQRRITVTAPSKDLQSSVQTNLKSKIVDGLHHRMHKIGQIAGAFGIKKVAFGLSLPTEIALGSVHAPYGATGGSLSCLSSPMMVYTPSPLNIVVSSNAGSAEDVNTKLKNLDEIKKDFLVAHEMVHIAKNHALISAVVSIASSILTSGIWVIGLYGGGLSVTRVACTYGAVAGASLLSRLFYCTQRRCQEKEADLTAIQYLESNEGAIAVFDGWAKGVLCADLEHPPLNERLRYARDFARQ